MIDWIAGNERLVALSVLASILSGLVIIWQIGKRVISFVRVRHVKILDVIIKYRNRIDETAKISSVDVIFFEAVLWIKMTRCFTYLGYFACQLSILSIMRIAGIEGFNIADVILKTMIYILLIIVAISILFTLYEISAVCNRVSRLRHNPNDFDV